MPAAEPAVGKRDQPPGGGRDRGKGRCPGSNCALPVFTAVAGRAKRSKATPGPGPVPTPLAGRTKSQQALQHTWNLGAETGATESHPLLLGEHVGSEKEAVWANPKQRSSACALSVTAEAAN